MFALLLAILIHFQQDPNSKVEQVGGGVAPPQAVVQPAPEYPNVFFKRKSVVVLDLVVGTDGLPHNVRVVKSGGGKFDENALQAVEQYRFRPALKNGQPVPVEIHVQVEFAIKRPA
jgi:protein TonB